MILDAASLPAQADVLFLGTGEGAAVGMALDAIAREDGMERIAPRDLWPLARWGRSDEETSVRRFLVSPPSSGFTTVLLSPRDWEHDFTPRLAERLNCRAAYLMLHDSDVFTCHLHAGGDCGLAWLSSPVHFDLDGDPSLAGADAAIAAFTGASASPASVARALAPPGRIDVDGRLAFARTHELLGLPAPPVLAYRDALAEDRLSPLPELSGWRHVAYQQTDPEPEGGGSRGESRSLPPGVVPFRPKE